MYKAVIVTTLTLAALGCGPEIDDADDPPGMLEYEDPFVRYYRLGRRVDIVGTDPATDPSGCGLLTDRAYEDLAGTLDQLDSNAEYEAPDCDYDPESLVYIEGFARSPFLCDWYCCHHDLLPIALVYFAAGSTIDGPDPNINGEIYVALKPDMPCPD